MKGNYLVIDLMSEYYDISYTIQYISLCMSYKLKYHYVRFL